jgi:hypothetical protein
MLNLLEIYDFIVLIVKFKIVMQPRRRRHTNALKLLPALSFFKPTRLQELYINKCQRYYFILLPQNNISTAQDCLTTF